MRRAVSVLLVGLLVGGVASAETHRHPNHAQLAQHTNSGVRDHGKGLGKGTGQGGTHRSNKAPHLNSGVRDHGKSLGKGAGQGSPHRSEHTGSISHGPGTKP